MQIVQTGNAAVAVTSPRPFVLRGVIRTSGVNHMQAEIKGKNLVITVPLGEPTASKSGKTLVVSSSRGNQETTAQIEYKGQKRNVTVGLNAYIYADAK